MARLSCACLSIRCSMLRVLNLARSCLQWAGPTFLLTPRVSRNDAAAIGRLRVGEPAFGWGGPIVPRALIWRSSIINNFLTTVKSLYNPSLYSHNLSVITLIDLSISTFLTHVTYLHDNRLRSKQCVVIYLDSYF